VEDEQMELKIKVSGGLTRLPPALTMTSPLAQKSRHLQTDAKPHFRHLISHSLFRFTHEQAS